MHIRHVWKASCQPIPVGPKAASMMRTWHDSEKGHALTGRRESGKSQPTKIFRPRRRSARPVVIRRRARIRKNPFSCSRPTGALRAAWVRAAVKTKALRTIFAGRLGSTPAAITLLIISNRNVFIVFLSDCVTASSVMYTGTVGIKCLSVK